MSRDFKSFLFIGLVLLSTLLLIKGNDQNATETVKTVDEEVTEEKTQTTTLSPPPSEEEITKLPSKIQDKISQFPQNLSTEYQKSIAKDPHQTPQAVLQGALQLGEIFNLVKTEKEAQEAFDFFAKCVASESVVALQTACFRHARELAKNHNSLKEDFLSLEQKTSTNVLKIVRFD